ncbi:MAG TPA: DegT/DnrJ/EryC1/StrS family aminotransferase [Solirubrobacteraceae bacterium]|jgi:dTDP-4-amino-4,6-dideoxygalactose transaminase|nr:DegT/DnrJ/EryC1/StrS family aminotransferase [Solirubrobacteraceae bacterium]
MSDAPRSRALGQPALPTIPLFDLELEPEDLEAVTDTLRSGWLTMGPRTEAFEGAFAEHLGVRHALALASGTAALHLAYLAAGIGPGDEVIVPAFTFVATANAVLYCGGQPVFADIAGLEDPCIDPAEVERLITPRTRAVAAVHFGGYPAAVDALAELCRERGLALIEDAAHAPSATLGGRKLGTFGLAGAFSLFSNKVLSVGEGGLLATDDDDVASRVRRLRSHAMTSGTWDRHRGHADSYDVVDIGFNYRLDEPRAALALSRLPRLEAEIARRRELTLTYRDRLEGVPDIILPFTAEDVSRSSCYVMPIMLRRPEQRAALRRVLREEHGIQTSILYPAVHEFSAYRERFPGVSLPRTELAASSELTIPLYPHMTAAEQEQVVGGIKHTLQART